MKDENKTKKQLIDELVGLRQRITNLEDSETERKRAEEALRESEERFRRLFDTAAVPLCFVNKEGVLVDFNDHFVQTFGYTHEDIPTLNEWWQLAYPDPDYRRWVVDTWEAAVRHAAREETHIAPIEYSVTCKSGEVRTLVISGTTIGDDFLATFFDITERKQAEEELHKLTGELKRSNADLQQFASIIAHDLQAPSFGITHFAKLLEKRYKGKLDEKADKSIHYIIDGIENMKMLIKDLLEYSRLDSKERVFRPVNCSVALEGAISNLRSDIEESGIEITYDILPTVNSHLSQLISLFQNLIGNAIKFRSKDSPKIHISAERKGDEWLFSVRDNGIGIDPKFADRIFNVFQRLHSNDKISGDRHWSFNLQEDY